MAYPAKKYNYKVEIDGINVASFSEVSGFDASIDVIEYRTGDSPVNWSQKLNGLTKFGNVTLKWGLTDDVEFYDWVTGISTGHQDYLGELHNKDVTITLYDDDQDAQRAQWILHSAWPSKYTGPDFNATSSEIAFESIELVFENMTREA